MHIRAVRRSDDPITILLRPCQCEWIWITVLLDHVNANGFGVYYVTLSAIAIRSNMRIFQLTRSRLDGHQHQQADKKDTETHGCSLSVLLAFAAKQGDMRFRETPLFWATADAQPHPFLHTVRDNWH